MQKSFFLLMAILIMQTFLSCSITQKMDSPEDFHSTGFIKNGVFQVIVTASPEHDALSLVEKRESSFFSAQGKIVSEIERAMADYIIDREIAKNDSVSPDLINREKTGSSIGIDGKRYQKKGYIAAEYYKEDGSAIIAYRIKDSGLKRRLNSTGVKLELK